MIAKSQTAQPGTTAAARPMRRDWMLRYSTLFALILLFVGFSLSVDRFLTTSNLLNIIQQISMLTIVGAGLPHLPVALADRGGLVFHVERGIVQPA